MSAKSPGSSQQHPLRCHDTCDPLLNESLSTLPVATDNIHTEMSETLDLQDASRADAERS